MNYRRLFDNMHPGFFNETGIKNMSEKQIFAELVMDLRRTTPVQVPYSFGDNIEFREYRGDIGEIKEAVGRVDEEWIRYFCETGRFFCAYDRSSIVSFCILEDWGIQDALHIGGPGCVGTIPEYRGKGIGLEMVRRATNVLKKDGFDISWIHYTALWQWYEKLGYQTVLKWNSKGEFLQLN